MTWFFFYFFFCKNHAGVSSMHCVLNHTARWQNSMIGAPKLPTFKGTSKVACHQIGKYETKQDKAEEKSDISDLMIGFF